MSTCPFAAFALLFALAGLLVGCASNKQKAGATTRPQDAQEERLRHDAPPRPPTY